MLPHHVERKRGGRRRRREREREREEREEKRREREKERKERRAEGEEKIESIENKKKKRSCGCKEGVCKRSTEEEQERFFPRWFDYFFCNLFEFCIDKTDL